MNLSRTTMRTTTERRPQPPRAHTHTFTKTHTRTRHSTVPLSHLSLCSCLNFTCGDLCRCRETWRSSVDETEECTYPLQELADFAL